MESQPLHGEAASVVCESGDGITVAVAEEEKMDLSDHMEQPTLTSRKFQPKYVMHTRNKLLFYLAIICFY